MMIKKNIDNEIMNDFMSIFDVVNYLNLKTDRYFRVKKTTARLIIERFLDGYTKKDLFDVIDLKIKEWTGEHEKYIRPEILFDDRFELYYRELNK
jgi:uncharacterized phage protein (TIGR02220 family)